MTANSNISAERSTFVVGNRRVDAYVARPATETPSAAVILVHEWWGLNRHIESIAERYASEGFLAVAPDLYHGKTTGDASEAGKLMSGLDQRAALEDLNVVLTRLRATEGIGAVGITGFCMGGTFALLLPCHARLDASVPFYGDVPVDTAILKGLSCPVLFIGGEKDEWIDLPKMKRLEAALTEHKKTGEVRIYKDAPHAFFNDTRTEVYREEDARDAWTRAIDFFNRHLRQGRTAAV